MPEPLDQPCEIGQLRWRVSLAERIEKEDRNSASLIEDYRIIAVVHAKLTPKFGLEFYNAEQLETPVTHTAIWRWKPIGAFDTLLRWVELQGQRYQEVYRVRRFTEWNGRHRYIVADIELEKITQCQ